MHIKRPDPEWLPEAIEQLAKARAASHVAREMNIPYDTFLYYVRRHAAKKNAPLMELACATEDAPAPAPAPVTAPDDGVSSVKIFERHAYRNVVQLVDAETKMEACRAFAKGIISRLDLSSILKGVLCSPVPTEGDTCLS